MTITSLLIATFVKKDKVTSHAGLLSFRHQVLTIIYANILTLIAAVPWCFIYGLVHKDPNMILIYLSFAIPSFLSFYWLRCEKYNEAGAATLVGSFTSNLAMNCYAGLPLCIIPNQIVIVLVAHIFSCTQKVQIINSLACMFQIVLAIYKSIDIFNTATREDQLSQMYMFYSGSVTVFYFICVLLRLIHSQANAALEDITKLQRLTTEVVQIMKSKDAFVSSLSHEIRNPLNAIIGSIDYLAAEAKDAVSVMLLNQAKISGEVLLNIVNNSLDAAKLRSDRMEIIKADVEIYEVMRTVLSVVTKTLHEKNIFTNVLIDRKTPIKIRTDGTRLQQILINLLSNAVKFTPKGGKIKVFISCVKTKQEDDLLSEVKKYSYSGFQRPDSNGSRNTASAEVVNARRLLQDDLDISVLTNEYSSSETQIPFKKMSKYLPNPNKIQASVRNNSQSAIPTADPNWKVSKVSDEFSSIAGQGTVETETQRDSASYLKIQVADNGCGIPSEDVGKLFQMFVQTDEGARPVFKGCGLGLWICKQLSQKMGG